MDKVILITGASSGIGRESAKLLAAEGNIIYVAARRLERMKELDSPNVHLLAMDLSDDDSMVAGINTIMAKEGRIDVLLNNAGYGSYGALEDVPISEARYQFEINIFGLARLIQLVLPYMRPRRSGTIINISSIGGKIGEPHGSWYHATKFAVEGLSDSLRMELHQFNINVVIIEPGAIKTEWTRIAMDHLEKVSGKTAYKDGVARHLRMFATADKQGSDPIVVARTIVKAINASRPQTRYATGGGAKLILFMRRILSDRMFDKLMWSVMK